MPAETRHTHRLRLEETETQLEMDAALRGQSDDYDGKLREAQQQLERLQYEREELERQKEELDELNRRKEEFINGQIELIERFSTSVTSIDRELFELRQELEDLDQTRQSFAAHLDRIERIEPESWPRDMLSTELHRALAMLEQAEEEFEGAVSHFAGGRARGLFGNGPGSRAKTKGGSDFFTTMKNGLAFNIPIVVLGALALLIYLIK